MSELDWNLGVHLPYIQDRALYFERPTTRKLIVLNFHFGVGMQQRAEDHVFLDDAR